MPGKTASHEPSRISSVTTDVPIQIPAFPKGKTYARYGNGSGENRTCRPCNDTSVSP